MYKPGDKVVVVKAQPNKGTVLIGDVFIIRGPSKWPEWDYVVLGRPEWLFKKDDVRLVSGLTKLAKIIYGIP